MKSSAEFGLLGPLIVTIDGTAVPIGSRRVRGVLAVLLLNAGTPVRAETLIDVLWADRPTSSAQTAVHGAISKLRKLFAGVGAFGIDTRPAGYVATVDPERLDLLRFARLTEQGRAALARGDVDAAAGTLERALILWRGEPLADLELPGLDPGVVAELHALHGVARLAKAEADIGADRHDDALPHLHALLAEQPLDERVHALAATALYRTGRPSDALDTLAKLRTALASELGVDPGPAIAELEGRIVRRDPTLAPTDPVAAPATRTGRKTVTALVAMIAPDGGSGDTLDPETASQTLGPARARALDLIVELGGAPLDMPGSRIAAVFGVPRVREDDAGRAIGAARSLRTLAAGDGSGPVAFRIGVASGPVLVDDVGDEERLVSEGPVDLASHLAHSARPGEILATKETVRLASGVVGPDTTDLVALVEGGRPMTVARIDELQPVARPRAPLIGRAAELDLVRTVFERASHDRTCSMLTILGNAGVGKTRLANAFLDDVRGATIARGRCLSYGRDMTYWPVAEILRAVARIGGRDGKTKARRRIDAVLADAPDGAFVSEQVLAILTGGEVAPAPEELFWAIRRFLAAAAADAPVIVVLEDAHWADQTLLDLLEHIVAWTDDAPMCVLVVARPDLLETRPGWGGGRLDATTIALEPLSPTDSEALMNALASGTGLPPRARTQVLTSAEGNPLFVEEALAMLLDTDRGPGLDALGPVIPPTVQAILEARLDRLAPGDRRVLERAAVIGRDFSVQDVTSLTPLDERDDVEDALDRLRSKDLITLERRTRDGWIYAFRHILIRDVAEAGTPKQVRAIDHRTAGEDLERRAGNRLAEVEAIVGYHLETACRLLRELGDRETEDLARRAAARLSAAGRRSAAQGDVAAASLLGRAISLLPSGDAAVPDLRRLEALSLVDAGRYEDAEVALEAGLAAAEALGDDAMTWRLRIEQADLQVEFRHTELDTGAHEQLAADAIAALQAAGDVAGLARAHRFLGDMLTWRGRQEDAAEMYVAARHHARDVGDRRELGELTTGGGAIGSLPAERCLAVVEDALASADRPNPNLLSSFGVVLAMLGRHEEAQRACRDALERATELGAELWGASVRMYAALAMRLAGDAPAAEQIVRPAVESLQGMGSKNYLSSAACLLAEALWRQGRGDEAMLATQLAEGASAPDDVAAEMGWRAARAKVLADRGDLRSAEQLAREAARLGSESDFLLFTGWANEDLAHVLRRSGKYEEALAAIEAARACYVRKGAVAALARLDDVERVGA